MKKLLAGILSSALLFSSLSVSAQDISVYLDDLKIEFDTMPENINDRVFVPLRAIAEALGAEVEWDDATETVTLSKYDTRTTLVIGSIFTKTFSFGTMTQKSLDAAPYIKDERTMVPVRFISETFGNWVDWDDNTQSVLIKSAVGEQPGMSPESIGISTYDGFRYIIDFGEVNGITADLNDDNVYFYNNVSDKDREKYIYYLSLLGFKKADELNDQGIESVAYEYKDESVVIAMFENLITVTVMHLKDIDTENLKYYDKFPAVPDYGELNGIKHAKLKTDEESGSVTYYYPYAKTNSERIEQVLNYMQALNANDFKSIYEDMEIIVYAHEASGSLVMLQHLPDYFMVSIIVVQDGTTQFS